jgi:FkbM family methyltransferase
MATVNPVAGSPFEALSAPLISEITIKLTPFDQRDYLKLIEARGETIRRVAGKLKTALGLSSAVDAGCGVGFFSRTLAESGLNVCGFDGRKENIAEARNRFPAIPFEQADIEDPAIANLGTFDMVLCFGLLYHLENPLLAIRNLRTLTGKCLLLESMCIPDEKPAMLLREEPRQDDQSLTDMACYPSEGSLVKMMYRAGFRAVYRVVPLPDHDDFQDTEEHARRRTVLLASEAPIDATGFRLCLEPREQADPWRKETAVPLSVPQRIGRFLASPARTKYITLAHRARRVLPRMPIPLRLPFGAWWLAEKSALDHELIYNHFEPLETRFVERLLRPGMTVLDVGAHHGLYTLLASKRVGRTGRVIAFEPSPRECRRIEKHLHFNQCSNVALEECALGSETREADLYLVDGFQDWCNSLRPPAVADPTHTVRVEVRTLDEVLSERGISRVDFIKLDVEGGELSFLEGASSLLHGESRPAILAEVQDIRTAAWGYPAREIVEFLVRKNYRWFALGVDSLLQPISCVQENYDANLVALPMERELEFQRLLAEERPRRGRGRSR